MQARLLLLVAPVLTALLVLALLLATVAVGSPAYATQPGGVPAQQAPVAPPDALSVSIDQLSPTALSPSDQVRVSGTVTNVDDARWRSINAFLVMSAGALSTAQELQVAADSPDNAYIGDRIVEPGAFASLGALEPGESARFTVEVPYRQLGISGSSGVYQLGVHILGTDADGLRSTTAAGRARTFLPSLDADSSAEVTTSVLWPLVARVRRSARADVANVDSLVALCQTGGRLRTMLDLARSNADAPLTLVLDPGLLDALGEIARGEVRVTDADPSDDEPAQADTAIELALDADGALAEYVRTEPANGETAEEQSVRIWLRDLLALAEEAPVWATGYAEPDLAALPTSDSKDENTDPVAVGTADRLRTAAERATGATLRSLDLTATRVWWPPRGVADERALTRAAPQVDVSVVAATSLPQRSPTRAATISVDTDGGPAPVVVDDAAFLDGGPGPGEADTALQVRQRIASETALLSMSLTASGRETGSAAVVLGRSWEPGGQWASSDFDDAFTTAWSQPTTTQQQLVDAEPGYSSRELAPARLPGPVSATVVEQAGVLDRRSRVLGELLRGAEATDAAGVLYDEVTSAAISQRWRTQPAAAERFGKRSTRGLADDLDAVSVEIPSFVTLSSKAGRFGVTINNGLDQAVTVGVRFESSSGQFSLPNVEPVDIGAGESRTVLVEAAISGVALDEVKARLVTIEGSPFGPPTTFTLRTSPLGVAIWIALGTGAGFVLLVVARRSWRQRRTGR